MTRAEKAALKAYPKSEGIRELKGLSARPIFIQGYEQAEKELGWHSVDECLPEIDEEVIVLTNQMHGKELDTARVICFAHRPEPSGWDGRSLSSGKVEHFDVETYNGWNIPGVKFWMPCPEIPNND